MEEHKLVDIFLERTLMHKENYELLDNSEYEFDLEERIDSMSDAINDIGNVCVKLRKTLTKIVTLLEKQNEKTLCSCRNRK